MRCYSVVPVMRSVFCVASVLVCLLLIAAKARGAMPVLDEQAMRNNLRHRLEQVVAAEGGGKVKFELKDIRIERAQGFFLGSIPLYAVKAVAADMEKYGEFSGRQFVFVVDPSGEYLFSGVKFIVSGEDAISEMIDAVSHIEVAPDMGTVAYENPEGDTDVVFLSDPFCVFCREAFAFLKKERRVRQIRYVHFPNDDLHPSAAIVCLAAMDAQRRHPELYRELLDYAYSTLKPYDPEREDAAVDKKAADLWALGQIGAAYPQLLAGFGKPEEYREYLLQEYWDLLAKESGEAIRLGFDGTPGIIVGGTPVHGFDPEKIQHLLDK